MNPERLTAFVSITVLSNILMALHLTTLALLASIFNKWANGNLEALRIMSRPAAAFLAIYAFLSGAIGAATLISSAVHCTQWNTTTRLVAISNGIIAFGPVALAFGFACKVLDQDFVSRGSSLDRQVQSVAALQIVAAFMLILYLINIGVFRFVAPEEPSGAGTVPKTFVGGQEDRAIAA